MKHYFSAAIAVLALAAPLTTHAATPPTQTLIKASGPIVYWYADDGKRYVFPNEKTFKSWFPAETDMAITSISDAELGAISIGGNVTYKPGMRMVKITTDPKVYAVDKLGVLRWVMNEAIARALYGLDWSTQIDDVPDEFFSNYTVGDPISSESQYNRENLRIAVRLPSEDLHSRVRNAPSSSGPIEMPQAVTPIAVPTPVPTPAPTPAVTPASPTSFAIASVEIQAPVLSDGGTIWNQRDIYVTFTREAINPILSLYKRSSNALVQNNGVPEWRRNMPGIRYAMGVGDLERSTEYRYVVTGTDAQTGATASYEGFFTVPSESATPFTVSSVTMAPLPPYPSTDWSVRNMIVTFSGPVRTMNFTIKNTLRQSTDPYAETTFYSTNPQVGQKEFSFPYRSFKPQTTYRYIINGISAETGKETHYEGEFKTDGPSPAHGFEGSISLFAEKTTVKSNETLEIRAVFATAGATVASDIEALEIIDDQGRGIASCSGGVLTCKRSQPFEMVTQPTVKRFTGRAIDIWSRTVVTSIPLEITVNP